MIRKSRHRRQSLVSCVTRILPVVCFCMSPLAAGEAANQFNAYFNVLDSSLANLAGNSLVQSGSPKRVSPVLEKVLNTTPAMTKLIRVNSKGKVINEVTRSGEKGKKFRDISYQDWFKTVDGNKKPYNGYIKSSAGNVYVFWARPLITSSRRFGGAVAATVSFKDVCSLIEKKSNTRFAVKENETSLFSSLASEAGDGTKTTLTIAGLPPLTLVTAGKESSMAASDAKQGIPSQQSGKDNKGGLGISADKPMSLIVPILLGGTFVLIILFLIGGFIIAKRRQAALLSRFEKTPAPSTVKLASVAAPASPATENNARDSAEDDIDINDLQTQVLTKEKLQHYRQRKPGNQVGEQGSPDMLYDQTQILNRNDAGIVTDENTTLDHAGQTVILQRQSQEKPPASQPLNIHTDQTQYITRDALQNQVQAEGTAPQQPTQQQQPPQPQTPHPSNRYGIDDNLYRQIRNDVYEEVVHYVKTEFEKKYNTVFSEKVKQLRKELTEQIRREAGRDAPAG